MCVHFVQSKKSDSSFTSEPTKRWHYCHTIQTRSWWNVSSSVAQAWWPVFKYYHLFSSYSVFISSCLGRILPSKLSIVPFVHKGIAITPTIFNNSLKFTYSERIVDSVMMGMLKWSTTPFQHTHPLDFTQGIQCEFAHAYWKLHAATWLLLQCGFKHKTALLHSNTLHILLQPQEMA